MRTWKDCVDDPTTEEIKNGMFKYALKIKEQAAKCRLLEDIANESNLKKDKSKAEKAIDKFYSMREYFNEY